MVNVDHGRLARLMPALTRITSRAAVTVSGLALLTGLATGPASAALQPSAEKPAVGAAGTETPKAPAKKELTPVAITAGQQTFVPTAEQRRNAEAIIKTGQKMKLPPRAWVIAVATSLQESTLHNFGHLGASNDHDSLGLFQQRPSAGWGTPKQLTNPEYAATQFYQGLTQVPGWYKIPLTQAAQTVQVSAYPDHYAKWEKLAADLVLASYGQGPLKA